MRPSFRLYFLLVLRQVYLEVWCLYESKITNTRLKASSHIDEHPPTSTCVYLRIGSEFKLVCVRLPSLLSSYVCVCERLRSLQLVLFVGIFEHVEKNVLNKSFVYHSLTFDSIR